jgi:hypothetical protein
LGFIHTKTWSPPSRFKSASLAPTPSASRTDAAPLSTHRFGGRWTHLKLEALEKYLAAYTTALKNQHYRLLYIDAFAGSGDFSTKGADGHRIYTGSARIALDTQPMFDELVFIEHSRSRYKRLCAVASENPERKCGVHRQLDERCLLRRSAFRVH